MPSYATSLDDVVSDATISALRARPDFAAAVRLAAGGLVDLYQGNRLLNRLMSDRGRNQIGFAAIYLHYWDNDDGTGARLTVGRVKSLCAELGICSPGRAGAMLAMMRVAGYLAPGGRTEDGRQLLLVPTELLLAAHRRRLRAMFTAMAPVIPEIDAALAALDRPEFLPLMVRHVVTYFRAGFRIGHYVPTLLKLVDRDAGMMVLCRLLIGAGPTPEAISGGRPGAPTVSMLARRFQVSRSHVRNLLMDMAEANLIQRPTGAFASVAVNAALTTVMQTCFATIFLFYAHCARLALAQPADHVDPLGATIPGQRPGDQPPNAWSQGSGTMA